MTAAQSKVPGIYKKIQLIRDELQVEKTGWDERNEYAYFRGEDTALAARIGMAKHGVIHRTEIVTHDDASRVDDNGRFHGRHTNQYRVVFIDIDDGSEFPVDVVATGGDIGGDKHARKSAVQAFKIATMDLFIIVEGLESFDNDHEGEADPGVTTKATPETKKAEQARGLRELDKLVGGFIKDPENPITGPILKALADEIAAEHGVEQDSKVWRKDARVLEPIAATLEQALEALKSGTAETIEAAIKLVRTGEVD